MASYAALWLTLFLLTTGATPAQPQPASRERQDRRTSLVATPTELRVAANNVTTVVLNGPLDPASLVVDRTRFKLAEVSDQVLILQPFTDLGSGERLVVKVSFKDRVVPTQAVFVVITHPSAVDGTVEVDRRANTPEALLAALAERDAQVEELRARCDLSGPIGVVRSGLLQGITPLVILRVELPVGNKDSLEVSRGAGRAGSIWAVSTFLLRNPQGGRAWTLGSPVFFGGDGKPVKVRSVWMEKPRLEPGEQGLVMVETEVPPWEADRAFRLELPDRESARRLVSSVVQQKKGASGP